MGGVSGTVELKCCNCGKKFTQYRSNRIGTSAYCSSDCYHAATVIMYDKHCQFCGREFTVDSKRKRKKCCSNECSRNMKRLSNKGSTLNANGYRVIWLPDGAGKLEHVMAIESYLGRSLKRGEVVHHKDHNRSNNDISNLQLMTSGIHSSMHRRQEMADGKLPFETEKSMKTWIKGKNGELELMHYLQDRHGLGVKRGYVFNGTPDLYGMLGIHIEVKRVEKVDIVKWYKQSLKSSKYFNDGIPTVWSRQNGKPWIVTIAYADWITMGDNPFELDDRERFSIPEECIVNHGIRYIRQNIELLTVPVDMFVEHFKNWKLPFAEG